MEIPTGSNLMQHSRVRGTFDIVLLRDKRSITDNNLSNTTEAKSLLLKGLLHAKIHVSEYVNEKGIQKTINIVSLSKAVNKMLFV